HAHDKQNGQQGDDHHARNGVWRHLGLPPLSWSVAPPQRAPLDPLVSPSGHLGISSARLLCTLDTRLWTAEGTEQVRQEKAGKVAKALGSLRGRPKQRATGGLPVALCNDESG